MPSTFAVMAALDFCYGHRLLEYDGPCRYLHGHNARVDLWLTAPQLNAQGMVYDFREIKRVAKTWIDAQLDHRMILQDCDPFVAILQQHGEPVFVMPAPPTAEQIAAMMLQALRAEGLPIHKLQLWEQDRSCAIVEVPA